MRKFLQITIACTALTGLSGMAHVHPAFGKKLSQEQLGEICLHDYADCEGSCEGKSRDCDAQCRVSWKGCLSTGGIFMDPQRAADPGKPPRRHPRPPKLHVKPHHRPFDTGGMKLRSAGVKTDSGHSSGTILRLRDHRSGGKR